MLFEDLQKDNITALKNHDKIARSILSIVYGKCKNESIEQGLNAKSLSDEDTLRIIQKTIKELEEEKKSFLIAKREEKVEELEELRAKKAEKRGGFKDKIFLKKVIE